MAKTAKMQAEEILNRKKEYSRMRAELIRIVEASDTTNTDRINAINTIMRIDVEGVPLPQGW